MVEGLTREKSPLGPYRVLDLTDETGVFCPKILAGLGADVVKVEPPGGDPARRIGPFYHDTPHPEHSLHWFTYNLNKRSITLNLESLTGQDIFKQLVRTADFVVECFRPGYLDCHGLGYPTLRSINPRLILTSITPWGLTGPYSQFKGSSLVCFAASGYLVLCGDDDRPPVQIATPVAYLQTGLMAAAASLVAHWHRQRTGEGQQIDISIQESLMTQILPRTLLFKRGGLIPHRGRHGAVQPGLASWQKTVMTKDGYVVCATGIDRGRAPIRDWLAREGLAADLFDKKWDAVFLEGVPLSPEQKDHLDDLFESLAARYTKRELMFYAQEMKIQVAVVNNVVDIMNDPHLKERRYFVEVEHPELGQSITYAGASFKSSEMSCRYWRRAPFIGEHNEEIYVGELGLSRQELVVLKEGGVI